MTDLAGEPSSTILWKNLTPTGVLLERINLSRSIFQEEKFQHVVYAEDCISPRLVWGCGSSEKTQGYSAKYCQHSCVSAMWLILQKPQSTEESSRCFILLANGKKKQNKTGNGLACAKVDSQHIYMGICASNSYRCRK